MLEGPKDWLNGCSLETADEKANGENYMDDKKGLIRSMTEPFDCRR